MKAYIYKVETNEIVVVIEGDDNKECERKAEDLNYLGCDEYGLAYSDSGLQITKNTEY